jgi:uncharacterized protein
MGMTIMRIPDLPRAPLSWMRERDLRQATLNLDSWSHDMHNVNPCRLFLLLAILAVGAASVAEDQPKQSGNELCRKLLATPANPLYPTRTVVSDPHTWKPVKFRATAPTGGVTLDDDGVFKPVMENNINYLLKTCPIDTMLYYFRQRAGQPTNPADKPNLGWWEDELRGSFAGRYLFGAGNTLRWIDHPELRKRLDQLVDGIAACRESNGYILAFPPNQLRHGEEPNYARTDFIQGLIEAAIGGYPKLYPLLRGHADWFNGWELLPKLTYIDNGFQGHVAVTRTYFTPVGKPEDLQAAERAYVIDRWMEQLAARDPQAIWKCFNHPHVFLIQGLEGYLDHYIAKGDKKFLDATLGGWDLYYDNWEHIGGSMAICEGDSYPPKSYYITAKGHTGETCGCAVWLKFNQRFHQLFPLQEKYTGEIEKTIYNVLLANQEVGKTGIRYHAFLEGKKCELESTNTCCEIQGARIYGSLPEYIYSIAPDGLFVNLFEPSTIRWPLSGKSLSLSIKSKFPFQPEVALKLATAEPTAMKLRIRVPGWAAREMPIAVNGQQAAVGQPGSYAVLDRTWSDGDTVSFVLPMEIRATRYHGADEIAGHPRYALEYGPILLAAAGPLGKEIPVLIRQDPSKPQTWLKPLADRALHYSIEGNAEHVLLPYWQISGQTFTCFPVIEPTVEK